MQNCQDDYFKLFMTMTFHFRHSSLTDFHTVWCVFYIFYGCCHPEVLLGKTVFSGFLFFIFFYGKITLLGCFMI